MDYLPEEIVVEIMHQLPQGDLGRLTRTCRDLYRIGSEDHVWKKKGFLKRTADVAFAGSDSTPSPRLCHTSVTYANKMYIFGGHNTEADSQRFSEVRNDIFTFDFTTGAWQQLQAQGMPKKTEHSTVVNGDKLFMFGGYSGHTFSNSMYMLNLSTSDTCVHVKTKGELPSGRSAHVGVVFEDKYYMFGGWDGLVQNNDFFTFHFETSTWQRINVKNAPHARCSHTAVVSPSRRALYVFGGFGGRTRNYLNDMWSFDFDTQTWSEVPTFGEIPSPRSRMRMVEFNDKIYIYGGWDKTAHFNELFEFDLETSTWRKIDIGLDSSDESFKIGQFSMSLNDNIIWIFGGYSSKMKKSSNELICYRLGQPKKIEVSSMDCEKRPALDKYDLSNEMEVCA